MTITLGEIWRCKRSLEKLLNSDLPLKISYKLSKLIDKVNIEFTKIDDARKKLVEKYSEKNEKGISIVPQEKTADFQKEFDEFLETKTKIEFDAISIEELGDLKMAPMELKALEAFIVE